MGQKVNPVGFRTGQILDWKSRWFNKKRFKDYLKEDTLIRGFIFSKLNKAGLGKVEIERSMNLLRVIIHTSRPGLIIGRGGTGVEQLKSQLQKFIEKQKPEAKPGSTKFVQPGKQELRLDIEEIKQPESHAAIIAQNMAEQLEKRMPYRRAMKQSLQRIMQNKEAQGAKIMVKGRLDGAEIARREWLAKGQIPLQTLRANIDYATATAYTTYGTVGVKVWIYKGEIF